MNILYIHFISPILFHVFLHEISLKIEFQIFDKFNFLGLFWNPQEEQNPKLSLEFNFEQDFIEKNLKQYATNEMLGTVL